MPDFLQPVQEILQEFALGLLEERLQPEVLEDAGNLPRFLLLEGGPLYGAYFEAQTIPPGLGRTNQQEPDYFETLLRLEFRAQTATGRSVTTSVVDLHNDHQLVRFFNGPLTQCRYQALPGVSWRFWYLILKPPAA